MEKEEYFDRQVKKIIPERKPVDTRNFFERNGKIIIIIFIALTLLSFAADAYVRHGLNFVWGKLSSQTQ